MKVFIWIVTIVVGAFLNTLLGYLTGVMVGSVLLFAVEIYLARKLCQIWDERKKNKESQYIYGAEEQVQSVVTKNNAIDSILVNSDFPKIRFCRHCGFELIDESEFCSNCGTKIQKEINK